MTELERISQLADRIRQKYACDSVSEAISLLKSKITKESDKE